MAPNQAVNHQVSSDWCKSVGRTERYEYCKYRKAQKENMKASVLILFKKSKTFFTSIIFEFSCFEQIGQKINEDLPFNNPAYVSCNDLKSAWQYALPRISSYNQRREAWKARTIIKEMETRNNDAEV